MTILIRFAFLILACALGNVLASSVTHAHGEGEDRDGILGRGEMYMAVLNSGQVASDPLCTSNASGNAMLTYDKTERELCYAITYFVQGLVKPHPMGVHLHAPAGPGQNVKPHLFALDEANTGSPLTGCLILSKQQSRWLKKGSFYMQIHTDLCGSGELRGQIVRIK
jgi:hypothetical protein